MVLRAAAFPRPVGAARGIVAVRPRLDIGRIVLFVRRCILDFLVFVVLVLFFSVVVLIDVVLRLAVFILRDFVFLPTADCPGVR